MRSCHHGLVTQYSASIVYFYAPQDHALVKPLEAHLSSLKKAGLITIWSPANITPGQNSAFEIKKNTCYASIILLLLTVDFLNDCDNLINQIDKWRSGRLVIPILLRPGEYSGYWFSELKALPLNNEADSGASSQLYMPISQWKDSDRAWTSVAIEIRSALERLAPPSEQIRKKVIEDDTGDGILDTLALHGWLLKKLLPGTTVSKRRSMFVRPRVDDVTMNALIYANGFQATWSRISVNVLYFLSPQRIDMEELRQAIEHVVAWTDLITTIDYGIDSSLISALGLANTLNIHYIIVAGRRSQLQYLAHMVCTPGDILFDVTIRSYDWILETIE